MLNRFISLICGIALSFLLSAYRIVIDVAPGNEEKVYLAAYYGDRILLLDSAQIVSNQAVFEGEGNLEIGVYTVLIPQRWIQDFIVSDDAEIQMRVDENARFSADGDLENYFRYLDFLDENHTREEQKIYRENLLKKASSEFFAKLLKAEEMVASEQFSDLRERYNFQKEHFFDNLDIGDKQLLRTPIYFERLRYFITRFTTQNVDTLISTSHKLLKKSAQNAETFLFVSDYLLDFSLRLKLDGASRLHNFLMRNRILLTDFAQQKFQNVSKLSFFELDNSILEEMKFAEKENEKIGINSLKNSLTAIYFWQNSCFRCISEAARFQSVIEKYRNRNLKGIAINTKDNSEKLLEYSTIQNCYLPENSSGRWDFLSYLSPRIALIGKNGELLGIFSSSAALDEFMKITRAE